MKMNKLAASIVLGGSALGVCGTALAEPFYMVVPDGTNDNKTELIYQLGPDFLATSVYTTNGIDNNGNGNPIDVGDAVVDSGAGTATLLDSGGANMTTIGGNDVEGWGNTWGLKFSYTGLTGVVVYEDAASPFFNILAAYAGTVASPAGTINLYYTDGGTDYLVMNLDVLSSTATIGNIIINANVQFTGVNSIAEDMFFFADDTNWFDLWTAGGELTMTITAEIDTNLDPQQNPQDTSPPPGEYTRTATLNSSVDFNRVPEPASIALLGAGLLGLGWSRRFRRRS